MHNLSIIGTDSKAVQQYLWWAYCSLKYIVFLCFEVQQVQLLLKTRRQENTTKVVLTELV